MYCRRLLFHDIESTKQIIEGGGGVGKEINFNF